MSKVYIRGVCFDNVTMPEAVNVIDQALACSQKMAVVTANSEIVQLCIEDKVVLDTVNAADLIIADGIGVIYASRILGVPLKERVPGFDLANALLPVLEQRGYSLFLLGAAPGVAEAAKEKIKEKYPGINICGLNDGYFNDDEAIIKKVNDCHPDVLFVCLGAPKQEKWMIRYKDALNAKVMIGLGGSLDVFSGNVKRAPKFFIQLGLEWLYRLMKEPWRMKRCVKLPKFILGTMIYKTTKKKGMEE